MRRSCRSRRWMVAFRRYEEEFRGYARIARKGNAGPFLAPPTQGRIAMRNQMFKRRFLLTSMLWMTDRFATRIDLKDYPAPADRPYGPACGMLG
ncbi:hypothetical protein [Actinoallomurus soli]|uniref:hypothetical protein n=1 Tax=Actinoallomurus soli TaxID=2952535 RepID=UPI0020932888|nr:hypothetical protein [Actinoallomurus soli]MCO5968459.1 hypothetical protein [Actinoallomurus soli]